MDGVVEQWKNEEFKDYGLSEIHQAVRFFQYSSTPVLHYSSNVCQLFLFDL
jgi:hypothetical protein